MSNFPGPYEARIFYTTGTSTNAMLEHEQRLSFDVTGSPTPGIDPDAIFPLIRTGVSILSIDDVIKSWVAEAMPFYGASGFSTWDYYEIWKYTPGSNDAVFITTNTIGDLGESASPNAQSTQQMLVFRTTLGGIMKINFMETILGTGVRDTRPLANADLEDLVNKIVIGTYPWVGRDGGWPFALIANYPGQNEAIFKKRFRVY